MRRGNTATALRAGSKTRWRRFAERPADQIAVKNLVTISAEVEQALVWTTEQTTARNKLAHDIPLNPETILDPRMRGHVMAQLCGYPHNL
ncbi:MAG: hypothetical protein DMG37_15595 [Acidobacteria bacterium]|nr:MAG: hypothetical protein DMG37_15595 [Acidobacteriota bacterium]